MTGTLVLGRYRVVSPLARGGMGIVFLARTEGAAGFSRPVVIKRVVPDLAGDEAAAQSFAREARILSNLQHPNIVNVIDFDEEDGAYVMVLEYVHGYNLGQWHRYMLDTGRRMPVDHAIYIMTQVLEALDYAHTFTKSDGTSMEIVHRDVSPGNILLDTQGHVKLLDFGIARANEGGEYKTRDGYFKGKLTYAAPEIYEGTLASPRSDVYSTAVVLYQLIAGDNPFRGKDTPDIVRKVLQVMPPPLAAAREDVPDELDEILARAMAKKPADRYATARAFADSLRVLESVPEQEFLPSLIGDLKSDFNQDMPKKLGLELLQSRDAAWRAAQEASGPRKPLSSTPPPNELEGPTVEGTEIESIEIRTEKPGPEPGQISRGTWIAAAAVFSVIVAAGATIIVATRNRQVVERPRFVVVEKPAAEGQPPANSAVTPIPTAEPAPPALPVAPATAESASATTAKPPAGDRPAAPSTTGPDAKALSRAFQRQQGRIENCFVSHVKEVDGRPEVSVKFKVDASGHVTSAELSPSALNSTPLGQCIVGVARSTDFGRQPEPFSFTIPITARRVK
jgi:eukaryotic-like serine/threonine-protein kinase